MKLTLPSFENARVLVVGDLMLDRYWHGATSRISPEAPVPVVRVGESEERPGGAANVALNVAALGGGVCLLGVVGQDEAAKILTNKLEAAGVDCQFVAIEKVDTITKLRVISRQQQLIRLDFEYASGDYHQAELEKRFSALVDDYDVIVFSDYGKGALGSVSAMIRLARAKGKRVLVDPKGSDFGKYAGASVVTPNLGEFHAVVGDCSTDETIAVAGRALAMELDLEALLVTRSEQGMSLLPVAGEPLHLPTHAREVFDVTGAGDTVISVLATALACGDSLPEATSLANLAAGIVVGKLGTATVTASELRLALKADQEHDQGVVSEDALVAAVADARARGERVVMTNGCFDLLHAGHVSYLEQARHLGDRLIVAVNDDASVKRLKGESRPVNGQAGRMAVLAGLASVDWVVPFSEDTPERLICRVLPDVLVKGGDYQPKQIAGYDCVTANGGEVKVLHFLDGCSTSAMIKKIQSLPAG